MGDMLGWFPRGGSILYYEGITPGSEAIAKPSQPSLYRKKQVSASDILMEQTVEMPVPIANRRLISAAVIIHSKLMCFNYKILVILNRKILLLVKVEMYFARLNILCLKGLIIGINISWPGIIV